MKQIEAVDYLETTVEWEQLALSDSGLESDLIWLLSVTRCRATYADNLLKLILWCLIKICNY